MSILHALILGILQGLCEFLPVSSSGHLVLAQTLFSIDDGGLLLDTLLHLGTLAAVLAVYCKDIWQMLKRPFSKPVYLLVLATVPAVVFSLLFGDFFENAFSGRFLGLGFLLTSGILFLSAKYEGRRDEVTYRDAAVMGIWQAVAILPGVSRAGSTIAGGLMRGVKRQAAARFSFLMSIPAILGSVVFQSKDIVQGSALGEVGLLPLLVGVLAAAVSGYAAIRFMLRLLQKASLRSFAWYTLALGALVLADQLIFHIIFLPMF